MTSTKHIVHEHNKRWHDIQSCRQAKQLMLGVNIQLSKYALRLSRRDERILISLLTGQNTLNRHLALLKRKSDASCPLCEDEQETSVYTSLEDVVLQWLDKCNTSNDHF